MYRLDVGNHTSSGSSSAAGPTVRFCASVDVPGAVVDVCLCDGALWSLSAEGVARVAVLDDVSTKPTEPAFGLDDAADALAAWDASDPSLGSGAAFAALGCHEGLADLSERIAAQSPLSGVKQENDEDALWERSAPPLAFMWRPESASCAG